VRNLGVVLKNGKIITGDGKTVIKRGHVAIQGELITSVGMGLPPTRKTDRIIDAGGKIIIPGIINPHEHYLTIGPGLLGEHPWYAEQVIEHLNSHLLQGTTTILNMDGLALPSETEKVNRMHPVNVKTATMHMLDFVRAIECVTDCPGLKPVHKKMTVEEAVKQGAVAIGEIEELSLWAAIVHLPVAMRKQTGKAVTPFQARKIQQTILGDVENPPEFDQSKVTEALEELGLEPKYQKGIIDILDKMVAEPHRLCHKVYLESAEIAKRLGIPIIVHYALESMDWLIELARKYARNVNILASHCDSVSFSDIEESITMTKKLKKLGIITNATSYMKEHVDLTDINVRLFEERLVDTICTDAAGQQDSILYFIERIVEEKLAELPELIAMATSNVSKFIPDLAPHRGLIQKGKIADLVMVDAEHVSDVEKVIIGGQVVIEDGYHARKEIPSMGPPPFGPDGRLYQRDIYTRLPSRLACDLAEKE